MCTCRTLLPLNFLLQIMLCISVELAINHADTIIIRVANYLKYTSHMYVEDLCMVCGLFLRMSGRDESHTHDLMNLDRCGMI